jgi:hypothetical protein
MTTYLAWHSFMYVLVIALCLRRLATGAPETPSTPKQLAERIFILMIYAIWSIWLLAQGVTHV